MKRMSIVAAAIALSAAPALSQDLSVMGADQDVSGGSVVASSVMAGEDGWLVCIAPTPI
jgi:hypothetical protein